MENFGKIIINFGANSIDIEYEEAVEILAVYRTRELKKKGLWHGNEAYNSAMEKVESLSNELEVTDY